MILDFVNTINKLFTIKAPFILYRPWPSDLFFYKQELLNEQIKIDELFPTQIIFYYFYVFFWFGFWWRGRVSALRLRSLKFKSPLGRNFWNFQFFSFFLSFTGRRIVFPLPGDLKSLIFSRLLQRVTSDMVYSIHMQRTYDRKNSVHGYR